MSGGSGQSGIAEAFPAAGGYGEDDHGCALYGYTVGGDGGYGSINGGSGGFGQTADAIYGCLFDDEFLGAGGGGGGSGRIRINTKSGCICGGALSGVTSFGTVQMQ